MTIHARIHAVWRHTTSLAVAAFAASAISACAETATDREPTVEAARTGASSATPADRPGQLAARYGKPASEAPRARIPLGPPPRQLTIRDLRHGDGPAVEVGDEAVVNYVGYRHATRRRYDTSYRLNPQPYLVVPGQGDFIAGFEEAIVGMRVGGLRQVTIPPHKAYGDHGYNNKIGPGETLIFVIELEALNKHNR